MSDSIPDIKITQEEEPVGRPIVIYDEPEEVQEAIEEAKEEIQEAIKEGNEEIQEAIEQANEEIQEAIEEAREEIQEAIEEGKAEEVAEAIEEAQEEIQEAIEEAQEEIQEAIEEAQEEIQEAIEEAEEKVEEVTEWKPEAPGDEDDFAASQQKKQEAFYEASYSESVENNQVEVVYTSKVLDTSMSVEMKDSLAAITQEIEASIAEAREQRGEPEEEKEEDRQSSSSSSSSSDSSDSEEEEEAKEEEAPKVIVYEIVEENEPHNEDEKLVEIRSAHPESGVESVAGLDVRSSIKKWQARERQMTDYEVLQLIKSQGSSDDQKQAEVLMAWTAGKKGKKKATNTMVIRQRTAMRRVVDFSEMDIELNESSITKVTSASGVVTTMTSASGSKKFEVKSADIKPTFQVRKSSVIQPASETVVTKSWIENAIMTYEGETEVRLLDMQFQKQSDGTYEAEIRAEVGNRNAGAKSYHWIIKDAPKTAVGYEAHDKEVFIIAELGRKIANFVTGKRLRRRLTMPYRPVILSDNQYAILDDLRGYKDFSDDSGFDMDHMRLAMKGLAKLHAMSYAYFAQGQADAKEFSETLRMIVDRHYQPSASHEDKVAKRNELEGDFHRMLAVIRALGAEGERVADAAEARFGRKLFDLYKEANTTSSKFSVLCHGNPVPANIKFLYNEDQSPVDVKFVSFTRAIYANAVVDLQLLMATALGPKIMEQREFLLRFVYHETLASTMIALGVPRSNVLDFDTLKKEYRKKSVFGCIAGAIHLTNSASATPAKTTTSSVTSGLGRGPRTGNRVFESKIVGKITSFTTPKKMENVAKQIYEDARPALRALALMRRALELEADVRRF